MILCTKPRGRGTKTKGTEQRGSENNFFFAFVCLQVSKVRTQIALVDIHVSHPESFKAFLADVSGCAIVPEHKVDNSTTFRNLKRSTKSCLLWLHKSMRDVKGGDHLGEHCTFEHHLIW